MRQAVAARRCAGGAPAKSRATDDSALAVDGDPEVVVLPLRDVVRRRMRPSCSVVIRRSAHSESAVACVVNSSVCPSFRRGASNASKRESSDAIGSRLTEASSNRYEIDGWQERNRHRQALPLSAGQLPDVPILQPARPHSTELAVDRARSRAAQPRDDRESSREPSGCAGNADFCGR